MIHSQFKDVLVNGGESAWKVMGEGDLSKKGLYPKIINLMKQSRYDGCLSLEPHVFPSWEALERSVRILRPLINLTD